MHLVNTTISHCHYTITSLSGSPREKIPEGASMGNLPLYGVPGYGDDDGAQPRKQQSTEDARYERRCTQHPSRSRMFRGHITANIHHAEGAPMARAPPHEG